MTLAELQQMLDELNKLIGNPPREQLRRLDADIREHYLRPYQDLLREYVEAWDQAVLTRLDGMDQVQWPVAIKSQFALFRNKWRAKMRGANLRIHFGQMRVGPDFQGALTVNQTQVVGFPQDLVVGRPLQVVAAQLQQGNILPDQIPLQIFYDKKNGSPPTIVA